MILGQTILVQMTRDLMILIQMIPVTTMIKVAKMIRRAW